MWRQPEEIDKLHQIPSSVAMATPVMNAPLPQPTRNGFLRCPVPTAISTESDAQRQFYIHGIPQFRIIPPLPRGIRPSNT